MVEHSAVNRVVVGSSPTRGVYNLHILVFADFFCLLGYFVDTPHIFTVYFFFELFYYFRKCFK